jgi:anti-anti-sigma factor
VRFDVHWLTLTARIAGDARRDDGASYDELLTHLRSYRMPVTVLDLSALEGLTSSAIDSLTDLSRSLRRRGCELRIVAGNGEVLDLLANHRLGSSLPVFSTVERARSAPIERVA